MAICMTETIRCKKCDFLLYFGETISERLYLGGLNEEKVLQRYKNICPNCGNELSMNDVEVQIKKW